MTSTWIESAAKGRHGGPVRAGMWSAVVVGTHPVEADQEVWMELEVDDQDLGRLPAFWIENKGVNSFWHVPIPPQGVGSRLHYRSCARKAGEGPVHSPYQDTIVRANLPDPGEVGDDSTAPLGPEGLIGNQRMSVRVDARGSTYDVYYPTVGLHSDVRPAAGDRVQSRSHFRSIVGGLGLGRRLDWFNERTRWSISQHYLGATNLLVTELGWRQGQVRVRQTDFVVMGGGFPRSVEGVESPGQYIKRFRIFNQGHEPLRAVLGVYVHAEINGGVGEPGLSWQDVDRALVASNRGHAHANRKLARDCTVEFALAFDSGDARCEPTGPHEAMLLRPLELPPGGQAVTVALLVSGAYTGWRGDFGTYEHWLKPALDWFRTVDLDALEHATAEAWDQFVDPLPTVTGRPMCTIQLRRSALAAALHADAQHGAIAASFDRGLDAYCWPRDAVFTAQALERLGHPEVQQELSGWLARVRGQHPPYRYWFQKYTIDGWPEWETPAVDQTAGVPWSLERYARRTGDLELARSLWPMVEQAVEVCAGGSGHPGLTWIEDLHLVRSAGLWDRRYGAFLYSNCAVVAGLGAAARLADRLGEEESALRWQGLADRIWSEGISREVGPDGATPGLVDIETGRFLDGRRVSRRRDFWADRPEDWIDPSDMVGVCLLAPAVPFGLTDADDPRVLLNAEMILRTLEVTEHGRPEIPRWSVDPRGSQRYDRTPVLFNPNGFSCLATLWTARYLIRMGRETGRAEAWDRAVELLESTLRRLGPLGIGLRPPPNTEDDGEVSTILDRGVWGLHATLIECILDLAGLDYDALEHVLRLAPSLPGSWPHLGMAQVFPCGEVRYRLERPDGGACSRLRFEAHLKRPVRLEVDLTCPELAGLGTWTSECSAGPGTHERPRFDPARRRISWSLGLPAGSTRAVWNWGETSEPTDRAGTVAARTNGLSS